LSSVTVNNTAPGPSRARRWLSGFRERETWTAYLFIVPWIFGFLVFTLGPMIYSAYYSFTNYGVQQIAGISPTKTVGFDNYKQLYNDHNVRVALRNTFEYGLMMVPTKLIVALLLAVMLMRIGQRLGGVFRTIFYLPHVTPPVAVGVLVLYLFNGPYGIVNKALSHIGINGPFWTTDPNWIKPTIAIMDVWACGGTMVILLAALYGVPRHLYEAAAMDGASKIRQFFNVTLPMISPALFFCLFQQAFKYFNMGFASAMAWVLFAISMLITGINIFATKRFVFYQSDARG
jgi:multiple sugar transport system permease protein